MKSLQTLSLGLILIAAPVYSVGVNIATQRKRSAHSNKPARFHYVCPMHEDVTSKSPGACPKCKMKLVRKSLPPKASQ